MTDPLDEYNPELYDDDIIDRDDGWRCLVIMETVPGYILPDDLEFYDDDDEEWKESGAAGAKWIGSYSGITYRTQADVPAPPSPISPLTGMPSKPPASVDDLLAIILKMTQ